MTGGLRRRVLLLGLTAVLAVAAGGAAPAQASAHAAVFTGYGFDTCHAPSKSALAAWAVSPYRAVGIYIGGANRACPDGNLSAAWVSGSLGAGWSLLPLYVGLQAPCARGAGLQKIDPGSAAAQGAAAADDAAFRASPFGLPPGSPVYFDMEGYAVDDPACTRTVQKFVAAWVSELHVRGFVAGVYGSAASTIRDLVSLPPTSLPDDVWIAHWNGQPSVFGDSYVTDALWTNHQRLHQYTGGHDESYGGTTLNIDGDYVDASVVSGAPAAAPETTPAGSAGSGDGRASVTWPAGAFAQGAVVTLTPQALPQTVTGFGSGGYAVRLTATDTSSGASVPRFAAPLVLHLAALGPGYEAAVSADGSSWRLLPRLATAALPKGTDAGATVNADGSVDVRTVVPGFFGLLRDGTPPAPPARVSGRVARLALVLQWSPARDDSGAVAGYQVLRSGNPVATEPAIVLQTRVGGFAAHGPTTFRVVAVDAAGNTSTPSAGVTVEPAARPRGLPRQLPSWAWRLFAWQHAQPPRGRRPHAPKRLPAWYWRWSSWRLHPFVLVR